MSRVVRWYCLSLLVCTVAILGLCVPNFTRPQLEVDEYRYLANLQSLAADHPGALDSWIEASIVENRWDHLWWIAPRAPERFFRPVVLSSFALHGADPEAAGAMLWCNALLHVLCTALVLVVLVQLLGAGWPALAAGLLFAVLHCHGEALWYATGRNASLAAVGFLLGLVLHLRGWRFWALLPYAFALSAKESTVVLPAVCALHDLLCRKGATIRGVLRDGWGLYSCYALLAIGWLGVRRAVVGPLADGDHYPYLVFPDHPEFLGHLWTQLVAYAQNLAAGVNTRPFLTCEDLQLHWFAVSVFLAVAVLALRYLRNDRRLWWSLALLFLTWLPTSIVYVSERYIYMPSIGWAVAVGLLVQRLTDRRHEPKPVAIGGAALAVGLIGLQAVMLWSKLDQQAQPRVSKALTEEYREVFPQGPPPGKELCFLQLPDDWLQCQFLEAHLRVMFARPALRVRPLAPISTVPIRVTRHDDRAIDVVSDQPWMDPRYASLARVDLSTGAEYQAGGTQVTILDGSVDRCRAVRFRFDRPLRDFVFVVFRPASGGGPQPEWIRRGRFELLTFD